VSDAVGFPLTEATADAVRADDGSAGGLDRLLDGFERLVPVIE
jgi:hypothetical protein